MKRRSISDPLHLTIVVTTKITADTFVRKFASYIAETGCRVSVIANGLEHQNITMGDGSLEFIPVEMERDPSPIKDLKSLFQLIKILRNDRPDILVYATPKASLLAALAGFVLRVPKRIYQIWGLRLETTNGIARQNLTIMEKITSFCSTSILANSKSLSERYRALGLNLMKSVDVIGEGSSHGVDLNYFSRVGDFPEIGAEAKAFLKRNEGNLKVGFVGRLHPDKGIGTLIEAVKNLTKSGTRIAVVLVGGDEGANIDELNGLDVDVLQIDHVSDVRPYYSVMDILLLPSFREGFPNVVLEAAAMKVPAIVSNGTGVVDSVVDGETGLITPVRDGNALASAILKLNSDTSRLRLYGENARKRVEEHFEQQQVFQNNLTYYLKQ